VLQVIGWLAGSGIVSVVLYMLFMETSTHSTRHATRAWQETRDQKIQAFREARAADLGITPKRRVVPTAKTPESSPMKASYAAPAAPSAASPVMSTVVPDLWEAALAEADTLIKMVAFSENGAEVNVSGRVGLFSEGPKGGLIMELGDESLTASIPVYLPQAVLDKCGAPVWGQVIAIKGTVQEGKRKGIIAQSWLEPVAQAA